MGADRHHIAPLPLPTQSRHQLRCSCYLGSCGTHQDVEADDTGDCATVAPQWPRGSVNHPQQLPRLTCIVIFNSVTATLAFMRMSTSSHRPQRCNPSFDLTTWQLGTRSPSISGNHAGVRFDGEGEWGGVCHHAALIVEKHLAI